MKPIDSIRHDIPHITLSVLFIVLLAGLSIWILRPFLFPMVWAGLIVIATWPLMAKLENFLGGRRRLAVTLMTLATMFLLLVPLTMAVVMVLSHVNDIPTLIQSINFSALKTPPLWIERLPFIGEKIGDRWLAFFSLNQETRLETIAPYAKAALQWFVGKAGNIGLILINAILAFILSAILFSHGDIVRSGILRFAHRLAGRHGEEAAILAGKAARGVVLGVVGTALIQASLATVALIVAKVPGTPILVAIIFLLCLAQVGPLLVLLPIIIWLYWSGQPLLGTGVLIISVLAGTVDNVVRPLLIRKGVKLPLLLIFAGVIGGLIAFGVIGLFIGPVLLAVSHTLLKTWVNEK